MGAPTPAAPHSHSGLRFRNRLVPTVLQQQRSVRRSDGSGQVGNSLASAPGSVRASSWREWMLSLVNTLRRCHSTVRGLRKSRAPISGFDSPSRARCAICRSWAVSSSRVSAVRLRHSFSRGDQLGSSALGESLHADRRAQVVCDAKARACVHAATLATQPFPVEQVGPGQVGPQPCAAQPLDRLAIQRLGRRARGHQCPRSGVDTERPVALAGVRVLAEPRDGVPGELDVLGPAGGLDQLGQRPRGDEQLRCVLAGIQGGRKRLPIAAMAVEEHRLGPVRVLHRRPLAAGGGFADDAVDKCRGLGLAAADSCERDRGVRADARPSGLASTSTISSAALAKSPPNAAA